jgi:CubicO group peptidase (beta-lactamase class C family)
VWQDGKLRWQGVSGLRDVEQRLSVKADTRFRLASVSKLFAATAAAQLKAQGKLEVDRSVGPLLSELDPAIAAVTPRQLAAHLSGIPHYEARDARVGATHRATARAALVMPIGLADWRVQADGSVRLHVAGRQLVLRLLADQGGKLASLNCGQACCSSR